MLQLTQELFGAEDPDIARMSEDESMFGVLMDFVNYFTALAADRRARPHRRPRVGHRQRAASTASSLPDLDMLGHYLIIATAGHDTTSNAIARRSARARSSTPTSSHCCRRSPS